MTRTEKFKAVIDTVIKTYNSQDVYGINLVGSIKANGLRLAVVNNIKLYLDNIKHIIKANDNYIKNNSNLQQYLLTIIINCIASIIVLNENKNISKQQNDIKAITRTMLDTYEKKNFDYGNSFGESIAEYGLIAALVRISDKYNRITTLVDKDNLVKDESITDTFLDLANYCVMTIVETATVL